MITQGTLAGRTLIMSGGSRGIGLAIAVRAARDGANVTIIAKTDQPHPKLPGTIHTAADEIRAAGGTALPIVGDVRDADVVGDAIRQTTEAFGGIDIVVNNASAIDLSDSQALTVSKYDLMQDVNVRGTFLLSRGAVPYLRESDHAHILSLSPPLNTTPRWLGAHVGYSLAKFGMSMVTLGLAAELSDAGIAANTLWPKTVIATAAVANILGGEQSLRRSRTPEIYADAAHLVLTQPPGHVTGQTLIVEDVLERAGVTDFSQYAAVPGTADSDLMPDIFLDAS